MRLKQMKHSEQTLATYVYNIATCATSKNYYCNIHIKHLKHFKHLFCNIGKTGAMRVAIGGERAPPTPALAATPEHHHHQHH
jgi:hypothetical protein